ncbi:hypothetical protein [Hymenobacter guriensis]|uniref:Uncharacterized protein n=1 Tax=Hymenobacter guriensis TaxID=2793065 RepID=A0ABS0L7U8_9BACT|nr:hypothetical protein [Hymenobacter guriensis]MBG8556182.1 hypothetical protein [Hymenobacter guriensis]
MNTLPPVPDSLRELARKQLARRDQVQQIPSPRRRIHSLGVYAKTVRDIIVQRTRRPGGNPHIDGGWANAGEWQKLLGQFDKAVGALRTGWQALKDAEPAVQRVLAAWQEQHGEWPDEDSEDYWLLLAPELNKARGNTHELVEAALQQWVATMGKYLHLLRTSQYIDGPLAKAGELDNCRKLHPTNRLPGASAAA